jgi:peptide/nickel transport system ATP-binding protein
MKNLKNKFGMSMILITHDMGVVAGVADRITVMYSGRVCETANTKTIFYNHLHPYTNALLTAVPSLALKTEMLSVIPGNIPNLIEPPSGCRFHPRCKYAMPICSKKIPELVEIEPEHFVACHLSMELDLQSPLRGQIDE